MSRAERRPAVVAAVHRCTRGRRAPAADPRGTTGMTTFDTDTDTVSRHRDPRQPRLRRADRARGALRRPQLPSARRRHRARRRHLGMGRRGQPATWTSWPPTRRSTRATATRKIVAALVEQAGKVALTSRAFRNDQLGALLPRPVRADRLRPRAADEHRRRGGGDGDQGGAQVGLQGQGRRRRARPRSWSSPTTSTAARRRSSASRPRSSTATASAPSRPASGSCRTATPRRWPPP